jgi:hypothetical protein
MARGRAHGFIARERDRAGETDKNQEHKVELEGKNGGLLTPLHTVL